MKAFENIVDRLRGATHLGGIRYEARLKGHGEAKEWLRDFAFMWAHTPPFDADVEFVRVKV